MNRIELSQRNGQRVPGDRRSQAARAQTAL
jgi:hypothetical protein